MKALRILITWSLALVLAIGAALGPLNAQERTLPYWALLRFEKVNMRVGPSEEYPIAWVYSRKGLPVKVVRIREGWRLVEDHEGAQGWISASQLDLARGGLVTGTGLAEIRARPNAASAIKWRLRPGVIAKLNKCREGWCEVDVDGRKGFVSADRLWGSQDLPGDA